MDTPLVDFGGPETEQPFQLTEPINVHNDASATDCLDGTHPTEPSVMNGCLRKVIAPLGIVGVVTGIGTTLAFEQKFGMSPYVGIAAVGCYAVLLTAAVASTKNS
ncbi:hypothetical protein KC951_00955 [Candidatus Saccharibacteria bacterium]|nr:hypothetical protein [Candidatus Saccharibacteria bacterium]